eukprot:gene7263-12950_t
MIAAHRCIPYKIIGAPESPFSLATKETPETFPEEKASSTSSSQTFQESLTGKSNEACSALKKDLEKNWSQIGVGNFKKGIEKIRAHEDTRLHCISLAQWESFSSDFCMAKQFMQNFRDSKKATGPDDIPSKVIKTSVEELSETLQILFNHSVKTGGFLNAIKQADVSPVFKKENPNDKKNYRADKQWMAVQQCLEFVVDCRYWCEKSGRQPFTSTVPYNLAYRRHSLSLSGFKQCGYIEWDDDYHKLHSRFRDTILNRAVPLEAILELEEASNEIYEDRDHCNTVDENENENEGSGSDEEHDEDIIVEL